MTSKQFSRLSVSSFATIRNFSHFELKSFCNRHKETEKERMTDRERERERERERLGEGGEREKMNTVNNEEIKEGVRREREGRNWIT